MRGQVSIDRAMTVRWSISDEERLVVAISEGAALREAGATAYRKLFDMTSSTVGLTDR